MTSSRKIRHAAILASVGLVLAACGGRSPTSGARLIVYSGQHQQTVASLVSAFTRSTGILVSVRTDDEATLANQILQEGSKTPAEVFYTENSPPLEALAGHGLLAPVEASTLAAVPSQYSSPTGHWVGVSVRAGGFVYNTAKLSASQAPASLLGLAQPAWKGKLGFAPSETDFQPLVAAVMKRYGVPAATAWLQGLKANGTVYPDNEALVSAVNSGQVAAGVINTYYWYRLRDEVGPGGLHSALASFQPGDVGNLVDVSGAAVLTAAKHPGEAQQFLAFLVSAPGQAIIASSSSYEYPIGSGVTTTKVAVPLAGLHPPTISVSDLGDGSAALGLIQKVGLL